MIWLRAVRSAAQGGFMSKSIARLLSFTILLTGLFSLSAADPARAQNSIGAGKQICVGRPDPNACPAVPAAGVPVGSSVYYLVTLSPNSTTPSPVTLNETYPTGFTFLGADCYPAGSTSPTSFTITNATSNGLSLGPVIVPPTTQVVCAISGFFNIPGAPANNAVNIVDAGGTSLNTAQVQATVQQNPVLPGDLSILKTVSPSSIDVSAGPAILHYTIKITNNAAGVPLYLGSIFELSDQLALIPLSVPLRATYVAGSATCQPAGPNCLDPIPVPPSSTVILPTIALQAFEKWRFPTGSPGTILPGGTITLQYDIKIEKLPQYNCVIASDGVRNQAFITLASGTTAIGEQDPTNTGINTVANNTADSPNVTVFTGATINDPDCGSDVLAPPPVLKVTKTQVSPILPTPVLWGNSATYDITIANTSGNPVTLSSLRDFIEEDPGTPLFKATLTGSACSTPNGPGTGTGVQQLQGYYDTKQVWNGPNVTVPGNGTVTCKLTVKFSDQTCDSWDAGLPSLVTNVAQVKYQATVTVLGNPTLVTYTLYATVDTPMEQAPICKFEVGKTLLPPTQSKIIFGSPVTYRVTFKNNEPVQRVVGTLGDFLRIVQNNYATSMPITYSYNCTLAGGVTGFGALTIPSTPGQVVYTALASQGVQILRKTNVTFPSNASVMCDIQVTVQRPPVNDPFCLSSVVPQLENLAVMDISPFYNPNMNWPPSPTYNPMPPLPLAQPPQPATGPTNWAAITLPLPKCFHLQVNKSSIPTTTMTTGGPIIYTLTIQNLGDDLVGPSGTYPWVLQDAFLAPNALTPTMIPPLTLTGCTGPDCAWLPFPTPTPYAPQFQLGFNNFPHGNTVTVQFTVPGPYAVNPTGPGVCNDASAFMVGPPTVSQDWYASAYTDPATTPKPPIHYCVPVTVPTSLQVSKKTEYLAGLPIPNPEPGFPLTVSCTPSGPSTPLIITNGGAPQLVNNIPSTSNCTFTETVIAVPSSYPASCKWVPTFVIDGVPHTANPYTITNIQALPNPHTVVVLNNLDCRNSQTGILKVCKVAGPGIAIGTPFTFTAGSGTFTVPAGPAPGGTCVVGPSFAVGSNVTVAETMQPGITVSSIVVAPVNRLLGIPNLAGGSVNVSIGSGVTEVTFTDKKTGYLEICKKGDVAGSFTVNPGGLGPFVVPPGACSPAIEVEAGTVAIQELPTAGAGMTGCDAIPANQQVACDPKAQTSTVTVVPGDISTMTIAVITNGKAKDPGTLAVKKTFEAPKGTALPDLTGVVFPVDVVCTPSGPSTTVNLTAANPSQVVSNIAPGSICNVAEQPLTATGKCDKPLVSVALPPTYQPGQSVTIPAPPASAGVEVANLMGCVPAGSLNVGKKMAPIPGAPSPIPPGITFPVQVTCTPAGPNQIVNLTAAMPNVTLTGIGATSVCTLTELAPIGPIPSNCHWGPVIYPIGQTATIPAGSTTEKIVQNQLVCK
jgi:hypothetical protein